MPIWDPSLAAKELERTAAKGATTFAFSENPAPLGLPPRALLRGLERSWLQVLLPERRVHRRHGLR